PRGLRTLEKAQGYLHGGISLQECVIPHLVSRASIRQARLGLDLSVSTARLYGGTVPVILRPAMGEVQAPLGGVQPVTVRLTVEAADGSPRGSLIEPVEVQLRPDVEELKPGVYLKEGLGLQKDTELILRATDAE